MHDMHPECTWRQLLAQLSLAGWARAILQAENLSFTERLQTNKWIKQHSRSCCEVNAQG